MEEEHVPHVCKIGKFHHKNDFEEIWKLAIQI
jgi:hypothetical protein